MIWEPIIPWSIVCGLAILLVVVSYFMIKFAILILKIQDAIEESLSTLDDEHMKISKILEIPLFHDSREIRDVLTSVKNTRSSILHVATTLTEIDDPKDIEDDNN